MGKKEIALLKRLMAWKKRSKLRSISISCNNDDDIMPEVWIVRVNDCKDENMDSFSVNRDSLEEALRDILHYLDK